MNLFIGLTSLQLIDPDSVYNIYPTPEVSYSFYNKWYPNLFVNLLKRLSVDGESTPNNYTPLPATPPRNRGTQGLTLPGPTNNPNILDSTPRRHLDATPRRFSSPPSPPSPYQSGPYFYDLSLENPFSFSQNFHSRASTPSCDLSRKDPLPISPNFYSRSILGRRERSSSPDSTPRNRQRLLTFGSSHTPDDHARGAATEIDAAAGVGDDNASDDGAGSHGHGQGRQGLGVGNKRRGCGRGRGGSRTGARRGRVANRPPCKTRGAAAPAVWTYDPRPALDADLAEEEFHQAQAQAQNVQEDTRTQEADSVSRGLSIHPAREKQLISAPGYHFILDLAMACRKYHVNGPGEENPISQIFNLLKTASTLESDRIKAALQVGSIMAVDSLEHIANRCARAEQNSTVMDFVFMINAIQLRCKVIRFVCFIYKCTVYSNLVLNLVSVMPRDGRRRLFLKRSRVQEVQERWQDTYLMALNFVYWLEAVHLFHFLRLL